MSIEISAYGLDPGLRNGALVHATFRLDANVHLLSNLIVVHSWKTKDADHLSKTTTPLDIARFANDKLITKMVYPAHLTGVEWEANSVYWRAQKLQVVTTAFLIGYVLRGTQVQGIPAAFFTPQQIKTAFGINPREKKEYMKRPIQLVGAPPLRYLSPDATESWLKLDGKDPDVFDAFLIAYLAAAVLRKSLP